MPVEAVHRGQGGVVRVHRGALQAWCGRARDRRQRSAGQGRDRRSALRTSTPRASSWPIDCASAADGLSSGFPPRWRSWCRSSRRCRRRRQQALQATSAQQLQASSCPQDEGRRGGSRTAEQTWMRMPRTRADYPCPAVHSARAARGERVVVAAEAAVEHLAEHRLLRGRPGEQRHRRPQLLRVDARPAPSTGSAPAGRRAPGARDAAAGRAPGGRGTRAPRPPRDRVVARGRAAAEPGELREHEPHPVAALAPGAQLAQRAVVRAAGVLRLHEPLQVVRVRRRPVIRRPPRRASSAAGPGRPVTAAPPRRAR